MKNVEKTTEEKTKKGKSKTMAPMKIDHEAIRNLAELLNETDLSEIEISEGDKSIRVTRIINGGLQQVQTIAAAPVASNVNNVAAASEQQFNDKAPQADNYDNHPGAVKSPMVGTVYFKPDPNSPAYVTKGSTVKAGDTLLVVEAMKVMNPIKAERNGTIKDILVEDAQPVEFGQTLVIIE